MTLAEMYTSASHRLNEQSPAFYPTPEIIAALNEGQRLFCLLTLVLEKSSPWLVPANTTFFHMLTVFSDLIVPLRLTDFTGVKIRPARIDELSGLDSNWPSVSSGVRPKRYHRIGADVLGIYPQVTSSSAVTVTYARAPVTLAADGDVPEIPVQYHPALVNYAINRVRQVEGARELAETMPLLNSYLDAAQKCGEYVRARNRGGQYDVQPFELAKFDRSQLLKIRKDLVPVAAGARPVE